jgi:hypothetical protein
LRSGGRLVWKPEAPFDFAEKAYWMQRDPWR